MSCSHRHSILSSLIQFRPKFSTLFSSSHHRCLSSSPPPNTEALAHLRQLVCLGINIDTNIAYFELALISALKSCSSLSAASLGRQIHSLVAKSGLGSNTHVTNSLTSMYAKCGLLSEARTLFDTCPRFDLVSCNIMVSGYVRKGELDNALQLFDKMPVRSCVAYTSVIMGFVQSECWSVAVDFFKDMRYENFLPNDVTIANVISACVHLDRVSVNCRMLHAMVVKLRFSASVFVSTNLLNMYCACSNVSEARILFDEMPEKNTVSWNVMLNGYSKAGLVELMEDLFRMIPEKDVVSWGTVANAFVQAGLLSKALTTSRDMMRRGVRANDVMLVDLVSACGRFDLLDEGRQLHCLIIKEGFDRLDFVQATIIGFYAGCGKPNLARLQFELGIKDHVASWNSLVGGYIKNGMIDYARELFEAMPKRDVFSWSIMISGYAQNDQPGVALELFHEMEANSIRANEITMVSVLSSIASLGLLEEGKRAHEYIRRESIPLSENLGAAIVDMYAKCGSVETALETFDKICGNVCAISPWNAIICGLAMHGKGTLALEIFSDLLWRCPTIKPNSITFIGVLSACCHAGLVSLGEHYFKSMKRIYNVEPAVAHYGCMVDILGRAGRLEDAEALIARMPMEADATIWGTLLAACKTHGNVKIGERAAASLARVEPSHGAGRVMLSSIYAEAGRWEEAFSVRRDMRAQRMKKSPGCSGFI